MSQTKKALNSISQQAAWIAGAAALMAFGFVLVFGWWGVQTIDGNALEFEKRLVQSGLDDLEARIPRAQATSTIWSEAVLEARAGNGEWLDDNLVQWLGSYYGFERVYLLDAADRPVRAARDGKPAADVTYQEDEPALAPLVNRLRARMAEAANSTEAITEMGVQDYVTFADGRVAIVSVRPLVPEAGDPAQQPGTEFVHIVAATIDGDMTAELVERFGLQRLVFADKELSTTDAHLPVLNGAGQVVGYLNWEPHRPASDLIRHIAPAASAVLGALVLVVLLLLDKLHRTSSSLEVSEAHAKHIAFHDALTNIPNRALFEDRISQALARGKRSGGAIALHYVDLDRFKHVNDTLGHPAGDRLLVQVSQRLTALVREVDTVARLGGDEFAVIQVDDVSDTAAEQLAARIIEALDKPFDLLGDEATIGASVGIAVSLPSDTPEEMMRKADIALYQAKENGRGRFQLFFSDMNEIVRQRRKIERDLRSALQSPSPVDQGLRLVYQPIYCGLSGRLIGAEGLLRWGHPIHGALGPEAIVAVAEDRGLIDPLGLWVLGRACEMAAASDVPWIAVNVSPLQFRDGRLCDKVMATIEKHGIEAGRIQIEITEGLLLQNSPVVQTCLRELRKSGIRVALDDFGTGYSSISYLRTYGIDKLKIDRSFVRQLGANDDIDSIVEAIVGLARAMNIQVTAEGVESLAQRNRLVDLGCDELQGFLMSRPIEAEEFRALLANGGGARLAL
ncbi:putative bifunctional diguanylate cyclase/phosphodiesterase [Consotaella aegiceratis]|uniref:putative bifunctional diguanylate cyclase/phosphodiesterase n=1 Tax=Consotaella aegiceratis TaxID=3097961 RepID=UPI002F3E846D